MPELRPAETRPEEPTAQRQRGEPDEAATGMFVVSSHAPKAPKQARFAEDHGQIGIAAEMMVVKAMATEQAWEQSQAL